MKRLEKRRMKNCKKKNDPNIERFIKNNHVFNLAEFSSGSTYIFHQLYQLLQLNNKDIPQPYNNKEKPESSLFNPFYIFFFIYIPTFL